MPAMTSPETLRTDFWKALATSPFVMLELSGHPEGAAPMTAQLDEDADSAIWFFTARSGHFAPMGDASVTFTAKGHDLFARFAGWLVEEHDRAVKDRFWSNRIEAWFPGGKDSPEVLLMRMDLGEATIWSGEIGIVDAVRLMLGADVRGEAGQKLETHL
jgi:general stress protein 26